MKIEIPEKSKGAGGATVSTRHVPTAYEREWLTRLADRYYSGNPMKTVSAIATVNLLLDSGKIANGHLIEPSKEAAWLLARAYTLMNRLMLEFVPHSFDEDGLRDLSAEQRKLLEEVQSFICEKEDRT